MYHRPLTNYILIANCKVFPNLQLLKAQLLRVWPCIIIYLRLVNIDKPFQNCTNTIFKLCKPAVYLVYTHAQPYNVPRPQLKIRCLFKSHDPVFISGTTEITSVMYSRPVFLRQIFIRGNTIVRLHS